MKQSFSLVFRQSSFARKMRPFLVAGGLVVVIASLCLVGFVVANKKDDQAVNNMDGKVNLVFFERR